MSQDLFRTSDTNPNRVQNSSYLDLGPLYGHNETQQAAVRTFKNGLLKPDTFSEARILGQPPGVGALLICFNRFHNYVVGQLAEINEGGRFSLPAGLKSDNKAAYEAAQLKLDNDLFQTGRLVTCGLYVNIILGDYVSTILNLYRSSSNWRLDPRSSFDDVFDMTGTPKGIGNQVSVEFNLIYRWHSTVSDKDEKWAQGFYEKLFPGQDPSTLSLPNFLQGLQAWAKGIDSDPGKWTFGDLKRTSDGGFNDKDLVTILVEGTEDVAGRYHMWRPHSTTTHHYMLKCESSRLIQGSRCIWSSKRSRYTESCRDTWHGASQGVASSKLERTPQILRPHSAYLLLRHKL